MVRAVLVAKTNLLLPAIDQAGHQGAKSQESQQRQRRSGLGQFLPVGVLVAGSSVLICGAAGGVVVRRSILVGRRALACSAGAAGCSCILVSRARRRGRSSVLVRGGAG